MLLLEHSSPVVLQLLNAVLNVSKGTVSTLLPANSIAQCDKQTMKNEDAVLLWGLFILVWVPTLGQFFHCAHLINYDVT